MNANELRIGNLFNQFGNTEVVSWVTLKELQNAPIEQLFCKPILLTEEWLLKFGFDKNLEKESSQGGWVELIHNDVIGYRFAPDGAYGHPEIKYVHQLQNLYFALTNEELIIKL